MASDRIQNLKDILLDALAEGESETADFKREGYALDTERRKACFVKDILALNNSVQGPGRHCYIFIGVERDLQGGDQHTFVGVADHPDDASLQNLVGDWTRCPPPFNYIAFTHQGVSLGAYELKGGIHIPCVANKTVGNILCQGVVYVRHGSRNDVATPEEIHAIVERRKLWDPSQATTPPRAVEYNLSPAEEDLLIAASADAAKGEIHILKTDQTGPWVRTGRTNYIDENDPSIALIFLDALERLVDSGYARSESQRGTLFRLRGVGFQLGRQIREQRRVLREAAEVWDRTPKDEAVLNYIVQNSADSLKRGFSGDVLTTALRMSYEEINDSVDILKRLGYLDTDDRIGTTPYRFGEAYATVDGFLAARHVLGYDLSQDVRVVAAAIVSLDNAGGPALQETTRLTLARVYWAVKYLEREGLIEPHWGIGMAFSVRATAELRRYVSKCQK
ncbi:MAG: hypothetical protein GTN65_18270 [Armatimonadetes bacterium]|nr:hypothetical protein [Armatimonadota bacterium]NIO98981.1 hypothetical protein [Armatimonadota bacterium]